MAAKRAADGNSVELNSQFDGDDGPDGGSKRLKRDLSNVSSWSIQEVCDFLNEKGLDDVVPTFIGEKITGEVLPDLTEDHLEKMGVESVGERLQVMNALKPFQKPISPAPIFSDIHQNFKVFNDPIHGHIEMHPLCVRIMDTPQFQRLRNIKQLGGCYYVFPGASHHRFEHCIGVAWLAGQLVRVLRDRQPELGITEADIVCVTIAGLCHDLGHGPYSHMFDGTFIPECRPGYEWKHEDASVAMFDYLVTDNNLMETFRDFGLNKDDLVFIKEQIRGPMDMTPHKDWRYLGRGKEKSFLYEVVANKRNGVDVDKWDYFARDCHHLGIKNNFDHQRFMKFARVLNVGGQLQICSRDKEVWNLYDMFYTRNMLHRRAYKHKTTKVVEDMITEAMIKANDYLLFEGKDGKMLRMSEAVDDMVAFCKITDHIYYQILLSNDPNLAPSKEILQKIERRQLYKCIGQTQPNRDKTVKNSEIPEIKKQITTALSAEDLGCPQLSTEDLIIHIIKMDYGMKQQNPIDFIRFYMKRDPTKPIQVRKDQVSQMLPEQFMEYHIRVYCKKIDPLSLDIATKCFNEWCSKAKDFSKPKGGDVPIEMTPYKSSQDASAEKDPFIKAKTKLF